MEVALEAFARVEPRLPEPRRDAALGAAFHGLLRRLSPPASAVESAERVLARPVPPSAREALVAALKQGGMLTEVDEARLRRTGGG